MTTTVLISKINSLPPSVLNEVNDFVDNLKEKYNKTKKIKKRKFGCAKGLITMNDDFDAPIEDFKDFM
jgi:hypothetical protein